MAMWQAMEENIDPATFLMIKAAVEENLGGNIWKSCSTDRADRL